MFSLLVVLTFSAFIGYFAQITGLCMVRGVADWAVGRPVRLLAILSTGFWVYLYLPLMEPGNIPVHLQRFDLHWGFLLGGLIFGFGAAVNGACSISTASRLSSGDMRMVFTMMGWLAGWLLLDYSGIDFVYKHLGVANYWQPWIPWAVLGMLVLASIYVYVRQRKLWRIWGGIMLVGMLVGAVVLLQPAWSPSAFVRDLGLAIISRDPEILPIFDRIALLAMMLLGMGLGTWQYGRFAFVFPGIKEIAKHLAAGILMGAGAAAALGGTDIQLLLAMPALSLAGFLAILGIFLGIRISIAVANIKVPPALRWSKQYLQ